jgi:hypothetical protein
MKSIGIPMTSADVVAMIPKILFPFNFAKSLMNSAIAMMLYKPLSVALKRMKLIEGEVNVKFNKNSVIILTVGAISLAAAVVILIVI